MIIIKPERYLFLAFITIIFILIKNTSAVGTHLLHAGPTCFILPNSNNSLLSTKSTIKHKGVCYSTLLCKQKGGVAIGKCGLGNSCCVFPQSCDSVLIRNSTYFVNPHYPKWTTLESGQSPEENDPESHCSLTIHRMPGIYPICKFHLDFIEYSSKSYVETENDIESNQVVSFNKVASDSSLRRSRNRCDEADDQLVLRGMHNKELVEQEVLSPICLNGRSQVTIDVSSHIGPFELSIQHSNSAGSDRLIKRRVRWNILITQIECPNSSVTHSSHASRLANLLKRT